MQKFLYKKITFCICCIVLINSNSLLAASPTISNGNITFVNDVIPFTADEIPNDGRGLYEWSDQNFIKPANLVSNRDTYRRFPWNKLETSNSNNTAHGSYTFGVLDDFIAAAAKSGQRVILGLPQPIGGSTSSGSRMPAYLTTNDNKPCPGSGTNIPCGTWYNGTYWPNYNNPYVLGRLEAIVKALGAKYNNKSEINIIQLCHYGAYGEYYMPDGVPGFVKVTDSQTARKTIDFFRNAFPNKTLSVLISNSHGGQMMRQGLLSDQRVGWSRMALGHPDQMSNIDALYSDPQIGTIMRERWKYAPVWTEMLGDIGGSQSLYDNQMKVAIDQVRRYHISYVGNGNFPRGGYESPQPFNSDGSRNSGSRWSQTQINDFVMVGKIAGYRYELRSLTMPQTIGTGQTIPLAFTWFNTGSAPMYDAKDVYVHLVGSSGIVHAAKLTTDLRKILPGNTPTNISETILIPSTVPTGSYKISISIKSRDNRPNLNLAINGKQNDGSYLLNGTVAVKSGGVISSPVPVCESRSSGDANCDNAIDLEDFNIFRSEFITYREGTLDISKAQADFDSNRAIDLGDFDIFRKGFVVSKN